MSIADELRGILTSAPEQPAGAQVVNIGVSPYIDAKEGLRVISLAQAVLEHGHLANGLDGDIWSYAEGVWSSDRHVVRDRCVRLLGERFRNSYGTNVDAVIRSHVPVITSEPIGQYINFSNCLYDWRANVAYQHTHEVLSTVQLGTGWDPAATCPEFDRFLSQVLPADMIDTAWEAIGYLMYSGNPLHRAYMLLGGGRNGKGTFLRTVNALLGTRNVTAVSLQDLVSTRFSTASLFGKLANIAGDIDGSYLESTATFKAITGQDMISAEHKGRDRFSFSPWAVPVFSANKIPPSADVTVGYLSRWLILPFPNSFVGREDRTLDDRLTTPQELAGIAAKAVPALCRLMARGEFPQTQSGEAARKDFVRGVDQVSTWVSECAELHPEYVFVNRTPIYQCYKRWATRDGYKAVKAGEFYNRLEAAGAVPAIRDGYRGFTGLMVKDTADSGFGGI